MTKKINEKLNKLEVASKKKDKEVTKVNNKTPYNNPLYLWDFRINLAEGVTKESIEKILRNTSKHWIYQLEKGETTNKLHYQGRLSLNKRKRKSEILKIIKQFEKPILFNYLEPASTNSYGHWFYVMKEETKIEGPWKDTDEELYVPLEYREIDKNWHPFQTQIIQSKDEVKKNREVNVIFDPKGNSGKTTLANYLTITQQGLLIPPLAKASDIIQYVCSLCMARKTRDPKIVFFDLPRALNKSDLRELFTAVEQIKNGILYDTRYTGKCWVIEPPAIWIFTNKQVDPDMLTRDRWKTWIIDKDKRLASYNAR